MFLFKFLVENSEINFSNFSTKTPLRTGISIVFSEFCFKNFIIGSFIFLEGKFVPQSLNLQLSFYHIKFF